MLSELEKAQRFGLMLSKSRIDACKTQKFMAQSLNKSIATIQNWESGIGEPGYKMLEKWFKVLNLNMDSYILNYKFPFAADRSNVAHAKKTICDYINKFCTDQTILQISYCMSENKEISWCDQINLLTALNHCSTRFYLSIHNAITNNYNLELKLNQLSNPTSALANVEILNNTEISLRNFLSESYI